MVSNSFDTPAEPPPPGQQSNFDDPWSIRHGCYGFTVVVLTLTTLTTLARCHTRFIVRRDFRSDDYLMVIGWAGYVAFSALVVRSFENGSGTHAWNVREAYLGGIAYWNYFAKVLYCIVYGTVKVSICQQILRLFVRKRTHQYWMVWAFIVFQALLYFTAFWIFMFQCTPISKVWNLTGPGSCLPGYKAFAFILSIINIISDILMFIFPLVCISKLHMKLRKKLAIASVFFVGILAIVASITRVVFFSRFLFTGQNANFGADLTFTEGQFALCSSAEIAAGIIIGNSVSLPRFYNHIRSKLDPSRGSRAASQSPILERKVMHDPLDLRNAAKACVEDKSVPEVEESRQV